jgi:hypothetical protein
MLKLWARNYSPVSRRKTYLLSSSFSRSRSSYRTLRLVRPPPARLMRGVRLRFGSDNRQLTSFAPIFKRSAAQSRIVAKILRDKVNHGRLLSDVAADCQPAVL